MTPQDIAFFAAIGCVSSIVGVVLGVVCRGRFVVTLISSGIARLLLFVTLEWRFGAPREWSWQHPIASSAYLFGPFLIVVAGPLIVAALLISRWVMRGKVIYQSIKPTAPFRNKFYGICGWSSYF
jgi:hypothetical protein